MTISWLQKRYCNCKRHRNKKDCLKRSKALQSGFLFKEFPLSNSKRSEIIINNNQPDPSKAGLWAGGTWEFIGVGRHDRNVSAMTGPRRLRFGPARGFVPQDGQVLGFMISAVTRNGIQRAPIQARTNVAFARITGLPALQSDGFFPPVQVGVDQLTRQEVAELFGVEEVNRAKVVPSVNLLLDD